jgi:hypothetical protein
LNHELFCFCHHSERIIRANPATQAHHHIKARPLLLPCTKHFPQYTFDSVTPDGQALDFASDYQPQSGLHETIGFNENLK